MLAHAVHLEELRRKEDITTPPRLTISKMAVPSDSIVFNAVEKPTQKIIKGDVLKKDGPTNFLGAFAAKSKAAQNAKKAALVGIDKSNSKIQLSNTGSGVPLDNVVKFKYQKGFTQAVRMPCSARDFM